MTPAAQPTPAKDLQLPQLVDEYTEVRSRCLAFKPNVNPDAERFAELEGEILSRVAKEKPAKRLVLEGELYRLPISPCESRTKLRSVTALFKKLGLRKFLQHCTVKLSAARHLGEDGKKYLITKRTGPREIGEPVRKQVAA